MFWVSGRSLLLTILTLNASVAQDTKPPSVDEVISPLGYNDEDRKVLKSGKIVTTDVEV